MAQGLINVDDICKSFLVTKMYGEPGVWPYETIAACKIICTNADDETEEFHRIFTSNEEHAEANLVEYLRNNAKVKMSRRIIIKIYMNYSPCSDCAKIILEYIKGIEWQNMEIIMTITFANFYKTHVYPGNDIDIARANIEGLKKLYIEHGVKFRLLGVHVKWERFLDMSEFFNLTEVEKDDCLDEACSDKRQRREVQDQMVWGEIFNDWVGVITSGLNSDLLEEIREAMDELSLTTDLR